MLPPCFSSEFLSVRSRFVSEFSRSSIWNSSPVPHQFCGNSFRFRSASTLQNIMRPTVPHDEFQKSITRAFSPLPRRFRPVSRRFCGADRPVLILFPGCRCDLAIAISLCSLSVQLRFSAKRSHATGMILGLGAIPNKHSLHGASMKTLLAKKQTWLCLPCLPGFESTAAAPAMPGVHQIFAACLLCKLVTRIPKAGPDLALITFIHL